VAKFVLRSFDGGHVGYDSALNGAVISDCGRYRYALWRKWSNDGPVATFVMLNPSVADARVDDPTIRKCVGFARRWGRSGIWVVNLFALRSTNPYGLVSAENGSRYAIDAALMARAVGPDNDDWLRAACEYESPVLAWGATGGAHVGKLIDARLRRALPMMGTAEGIGELTCLGRSKSGHPRHPLMLAYSTPLERFEVRS
jgi:hypothetical protein